MELKDFGYAITVRRVMLNLGRGAAATAAGLSYPFYCELEKGQKNPSLDSLRCIATGLRFESLSAMFRWAEETVANRP